MGVSAGHLTDRVPSLGAVDLAARFRPPRRFGNARFDTFAPNPEHPSQAAALMAMELLAAEISAAAPPIRLRWGRGKPEAYISSPGWYLDGGFGVGKTHLLAAAWHAAPSPKAYLTFS